MIPWSRKWPPTPEFLPGKETIVLIQLWDDGSLYQTGRDGSGKELSMSAFVLQTETREFSGEEVVGSNNRDWQFWLDKEREDPFKTLDWPKSSFGFFCKLNITPWMYAVRGYLSSLARRWSRLVDIDMAGQTKRFLLMSWFVKGCAQQAGSRSPRGGTGVHGPEHTLAVFWSDRAHKTSEFQTWVKTPALTVTVCVLRQLR